MVLLFCKNLDLFIFEGHVYFSDWKLEAIIRINKKGNQQVTLRKGIEFLRDITIYDKDIQQKPGMIYIIFIQQTKTFKKYVENKSEINYCVWKTNAEMQY